MKWFAKRSPERFTPKVETLEDRCTPAVTLNVVGDTLFLTGDAGDNYIFITDRGDGGAGNLSVTTEDGVFIPAPETAIRHIVINTFAGNDTVSYVVNNNFSSEMNIVVGLGDGNDTFVVRAHQLMTNSRLRVTAFGGAGNDTIRGEFMSNVQFGAAIEWHVFGEAGNDRVGLTLMGNLLNNSSLISIVDLGAGDDRWDTLIQGTVFSNAQLLLNADGGAGADIIDTVFRTDHIGGSRTRINYMGGDGDDQIRINALDNVDVEAAAELIFQVDGGAGADFISLDHGGRVNGVFTALLFGGIGNDTIRGTQFLTRNSNSRRNSNIWRVNGGEGNDVLSLRILPFALFSEQRVNARILGGPGFDRAQRTPNVLAIGTEA